MADATPASQPPSNHSQGQGNSRNRRRRNARHADQQNARPASSDVLAMRPASVAPASQRAPNNSSSNGQVTAETRGGGGGGGGGGSEAAGTAGRQSTSGRQPTVRGGSGGSSSRPSGMNEGRGRRSGVRASRGAGRAGATGAQTHLAGRRQFGGQLTSEQQEPQGVEDPSGLQPDAAEFVPGQSHSARPRRQRRPPPTHAPGPRPRAGSIQKSNADDILTRTHEDISSGAYECLICSESVHRKSKIWTCHTCWAVLHLPCVKKWSSNEAATVSQGRTQDGELAAPRQWRCPGCNLPQDDQPSSYACWCGKENDPVSIPGLPPHSCGQSCGKEKVRPRKCPHTCDLVCHAGPCPPCTALGPVLSCFCGQKTAQKSCVETNYDEGFSCGAICGEMMPCGNPDHVCERPCHEGLCGACLIPSTEKCYCGRIEKELICSDKDDEKRSTLVSVDGSSEEWTGVFRCGATCEGALDCGVHSCQKPCHSQGIAGDHHCPLSTDIILHCTCGKTSLSELGVVRQSCQDPVPACTKVCGRQLPCGHGCDKICHTGECPPCPRTVNVECVCGRTSSPSICHQGMEAKPLCARICRTMLNCGRHACENHCCSGEKRAAERLASKRKHRPLGAPPVREDFEAEHICVRQCGRPLSCGDPDHTCQELCHKGKCNSCPNAIFDEVSCHCGRSVLYPPLPCGTQPPPCRSQCQRPNACNLHPPVQHNCHGDDEACPKCPFLTAKKCMCGKKTLKNQPCFSTNVSCGTVCGNTLGCGRHTCRKTCHAPGDCEDSNGSCSQPCGRLKAKCDHPDLSPCHEPRACNETKACQSKMMITCECARLRVETKCLATISSEGNLSKKLSCDEECARLARNRQLATALNVDPAEQSNDHVPYDTTTLRLYQENGKFAVEQEQRFRLFAADPSERSLRFKPMKKLQRGFLHALATDFGFESESLDPEPHRHVVVFKTPRFSSAPMKTIAESIRIRTLQGKLRPPETTSSANASDTEAGLASDERVPYNGFVLHNPRFGLTVDELQRDLAPSFRLSPTLAFDIAFLPSEEIVMKAKASSPTTTLAPAIIQSGLKGLKASISSVVADKKLAGSVGLCVLDSSMNLLRKEQDANATAIGWSTVAKSGASRPRLINQSSSAASGSRFLVLGKKRPQTQQQQQQPEKTKKKEVVEDVADDWEEEMNREEAEQQRALAAEAESGGASGGVSDGDAL